MIILDTCALLWLANDQSQLSEKALERIEEDIVVYILAVTGYEIGIKYYKKKLELPVPPEEWLEKTCKHHNIEVLPLDLRICIQATRLPPIHNDPVDRMIIAAALRYNYPIITKDRLFSEYGVEVIG